MKRLFQTMLLVFALGSFHLTQPVWAAPVCQPEIEAIEDIGDVGGGCAIVIIVISCGRDQAECEMESCGDGSWIGLNCYTS